MEQVFKIKVPKGLPTAVARFPKLRKAVGSLLVLKTIEESGMISATRSGLQSYKSILGVSYKTLERRLKLLADYNFVTLEGKFYKLCSYDFICEIFKLNSGTRYFIRYTGKTKIDLILEAKAIEEKQKKCNKAFHTRLTKAQGIAPLLKNAVGTLSSEAINFEQLFSFINEGKTYEEINYELNVFRADANVNYKTLSKMFDYSSRGGMAYRKRILQKAGLIIVNKREVVLEGHTTKNSRKTKLGNVYFNRQLNRPVLVMPDEIKFVALKNIA